MMVQITAVMETGEKAGEESGEESGEQYKATTIITTYSSLCVCLFNI